jgi:hypothetical protein
MSETAAVAVQSVQGARFAPMANAHCNVRPDKPIVAARASTQTPATAIAEPATILALVHKVATTEHARSFVPQAKPNATTDVSIPKPAVAIAEAAERLAQVVVHVSMATACWSALLAKPNAATHASTQTQTMPIVVAAIRSARLERVATRGRASTTTRRSPSKQ